MTLEEKYINKKKKDLCDYINSVESNINVTEDNIFKLLTDSNICKNCRKCCNHIPCIFRPNDFIDINDLDYMKNILETGLIRISYVLYYGNYGKKVYILGPCGTRDDDICFDPKFDNNTCILNSRNGCMLDVNFRPSGALLLLPREKYRCHCLYQTENIVNEYEKYSDTLKSLKYKYDNICKTETTIEEVKTLTRKIAGYKK